MHIFYAPDIKDSNEYVLNEEESKHCIRVLRLRKGDNIKIIDGQGGEYTASIKNDQEKKCTVEIISAKKEAKRKNFTLHIAIAPTKNIERFEWFLEKATEMGIDEITPLICEHSERTTVKTERLNKILVAAMKQSFRVFLPKLNEAKIFSEFIQTKTEGQKLIAHCHSIRYNESNDKNIYLKNIYLPNTSVTILIGPEGDFSAEEVKEAIDKGYKEIILSTSRLRTETAGIVACNIINFINP